jgi:DNA-binding PadR family transcriptional regulator
LFLKETPTNLILTLNKYEEIYLSQLIKEAKVAYSHSYYILDALEKLKIIKTEKVENIKLIKLTEKGKKIANLLNEILLLSGD